MHFLPFISTILATAVLVASEPSAQFDIAASDFDTLSTDTSYDLIPCSYQPPGLIIRPDTMEIWQEISLHHLGNHLGNHLGKHQQLVVKVHQCQGSNK